MPTRRSVLLDLAAAVSFTAMTRRALGQTPLRPEPGPAVMTGIDVLAAGGFMALQGLRVGVITNQTGRDRSGRRTIDLLHAAPGVRLGAIFSPEHGLGGDREGRIESGLDAATGLRVQSLYGSARRPSAEMLEGLDALVIDLQDVGVRFFTYATTMAYALEAAAPLNLGVFVLDRPNPIAPAGVRGPLLDPDLKAFTAYLPTPVQHGMTMGELARMVDAENLIGARLEIVAMSGWRRSLWFDQTGMDWVAPSPNLKTLDEAILYPGVGLIEGTNLSVGRGTAAPFTVVGAPWIDGEAFVRALGRRRVPGVRFEPTQFTPAADRYAQEPCGGARIVLTDRSLLDAPRLGVELAGALQRLHPDRFKIEGMLGSLGSRESLARIARGDRASDIIAAWRPALEGFQAVRSRHLIYPAD